MTKRKALLTLQSILDELGIIRIGLDSDYEPVKYQEYTDKMNAVEYAMAAVDDLPDATEAVENCPYCEHTNIFPGWDVEKQGYIATCQECGEKIFLCDECHHADDYEGCNWWENFDDNYNIVDGCCRGKIVH